MRSSSLLVKYFFYVILLSVMLAVFSYQDVRNTHKMLVQERKVLLENLSEIGKAIEELEYKNKSIWKHLLIWTNPNHIPFTFLGKGQQVFIDEKCLYTNCFVTSDRNYLDGDLTKFDVIAFHGPEVVRYQLKALPSRRSPHQKFVFESLKSSDNYPRCDNLLDGFFNWTWTYKLDSDAMWGYVVVRDSDKKVIGPKTIMHWMDLQDMDPVSNELKLKLKSKRKAAAWRVYDCHTRSNREQFVKNLKNKLKKFNLTVDVYGECGKFTCNNDCPKKTKEVYYFYLVFENAFSEDYVTEKLLHAVKNNAVPVVFGGANYSRFLPKGSYLNARELGAEKLATTMNYLIKNPDKYYEYFRWQNHYSYHRTDESPETNSYCRLCAMMNDEQLMRKTTVYKKFKEWWTPPGRC